VKRNINARASNADNVSPRVRQPNIFFTDCNTVFFMQSCLQLLKCTNQEGRKEEPDTHADSTYVQ
jgi:hypothetical protein